MSVVAALPLSEVEVPSREQISAVLDALCPSCGAEFAAELVEAIRESVQRGGDARPIQDTVDAWYSSILFLQDHDSHSQHAMLRELAREKPMTFEEVRAKLGV